MEPLQKQHAKPKDYVPIPFAPAHKIDTEEKLKTIE